MSATSATPVPPARLLLELLTETGQTLSFCESLTAGLAAATFAGVPGASTVLRGGLVTYATELKIDLAGVPREVVDKHGVVSPECAAAMATGTRERCSSDWALSLTGVAGPDSQDGHPVGEVWIGLAGPGGRVESIAAFSSREQVRLAELARRSPLEGRQKIRETAVHRCFEILIDRLTDTFESG